MIVFNGGWCVAVIVGVALVVAFNAWGWFRDRGSK